MYSLRQVDSKTKKNMTFRFLGYEVQIFSKQANGSLSESRLYTTLKGKWSQEGISLA